MKVRSPKEGRRQASARAAGRRFGRSIRSDHGRLGMTFAEWVRKWRIGPGMNDAHPVTKSRISTCRFLGHLKSADDMEALLAEGLYSGSDGRVGLGWIPMLDRLVRDLLALGWDRDLHQVKEKFGTLRFYVGESTAAMEARIEEAETEALRICEACGRAKPIFVETGSYCRRCGT